jgi:hypothetical protein
MVSVNLWSEKTGEIDRFLSKFYNTSISLDKSLNWEQQYKNPIEIAEIIGTFADNSDDFLLAMWISLDKGVFIHVTENNADDIIKYLYERFPY